MKSKFTIFALAAFCVALAGFATNPTISAKPEREEKERSRSQLEAGPFAVVEPVGIRMITRSALNPTAQFQGFDSNRLRRSSAANARREWWGTNQRSLRRRCDIGEGEVHRRTRASAEGN